MNRPGHHLGRKARAVALVRTSRGGVLLLAAVVAGLGTGRPRSDFALPVVRTHTSDYVIYYDSRAAPSVAEAAVDLRDYVARATGASLPIVSAAQAPPPPFIALGDTRESRNAGVTVDGMPAGADQEGLRGHPVDGLGCVSRLRSISESGGTSS